MSNENYCAMDGSIGSESEVKIDDTDSLFGDKDEDCGIFTCDKNGDNAGEVAIVKARPTPTPEPPVFRLTLPPRQPNATTAPALLRLTLPTPQVSPSPLSASAGYQLKLPGKQVTTPDAGSRSLSMAISGGQQLSGANASTNGSMNQSCWTALPDLQPNLPVVLPFGDLDGQQRSAVNASNVAFGPTENCAGPSLSSSWPCFSVPSPAMSISSYRSNSCAIETQFIPSPAFSSQASNDYGLAAPAYPDPFSVFHGTATGPTSGECVVSSLHVDEDKHTPTPEQGIMNDANALMEYQILRNQAVKSLAAFEDVDHSRGIPLRNLVGPSSRFRTEHIARIIRIPRRLDLDAKHIDVLIPYLNLNRHYAFRDIYNELELSDDESKAITKALKSFMENPFFQRLAQEDERYNSHKLTFKIRLARASWDILKTCGWGLRWFSKSTANGSERAKHWPRDSAHIIYHFASLLFRVIFNDKQRRRDHKKRSARELLATVEAPLAPLQGLFESAYLTDASMYAPGATPIRSPPAPDPPAPKQLPLPRLGVDVNSLIRKATSAKQRRDTSEFPLASYAVDIPEDADLRYRITVKDARDGGDLLPPSMHRHGDDIIRQGFTKLVTLFAASGHDARVEILVPGGMRHIDNDGDWDQAVLAIYNRRPEDAVVDVFIHF